MKIAHNNKNYSDQSAIHTGHFAEVIQSSLSTFTAQTWAWDNPPPFGSLVVLEQDSILIIGCVMGTRTGSIDSQRQPMAMQKTEAELRAEQPQIFALLRTTFDAAILGHIEKSERTIRYLLPPKPPKIHTFVASCSSRLASAFLKKQSSLNLLFSLGDHALPIDEILLALLHHARKEDLDEATITALCEHYAMLIKNDYHRLRLFLHRLHE